MKRLFLLSFALALLSFSCTNAPPNEFTDQSKATVEKEVKARSNESVSNLSLLDIEVWSEYWSEDHFIAVTSGPNYFKELSVFTDSVAYWFSQRESQVVDQYRVDVTALGPERALVRFGAIWSVVLKNGDSFKVDASVSSLWMKEEDTWRIIYLHESWQPVE
jgi:hypothetical protein